MPYPDQVHIDRIRSALWSGREFGRAAVMVGAGLSLNARPMTLSAPSFPTWRALTQRLIDELYPAEHSTEEEREEAQTQARSTSGALRLAEEYRAAFRSEALESFLLAQIPDSLYT